MKTTDEKFHPKYITDMGKCNGPLPSPWVETDIREFWYLYMSYKPDNIEYRQIMPKEEPKLNLPYCTSVKIFYFHDIAYAVLCPNGWEWKDENGKNLGRIRYKDHPRCLRIGCAHKWKELNKEECGKRKILHFGNCYHVSECEKCGLIESVDSSD